MKGFVTSCDVDTHSIDRVSWFYYGFFKQHLFANFRYERQKLQKILRDTFVNFADLTPNFLSLKQSCHMLFTAQRCNSKQLSKPSHFLWECNAVNACVHGVLQQALNKEFHTKGIKCDNTCRHCDNGNLFMGPLFISRLFLFEHRLATS